MKILSITLEKCSGCALLIDNEIVFATSEERYSRIKSDSSFPMQSILRALKFAKIEGSDLDQVIICGNMLSLIPSLTNEYSTLDVDEQLKLMKDYWYPTLVEKKSISFLELIRDKINLDQYPFNTEFAKDFDYFALENPYTDDDAKHVSQFFKNVLSDLLKIDQSKIIHMEHDWCHAAYAFYASPIRDGNTLVVTADAWGDDLSGSISIFDKEKNQLKRIKEYSHKDFQLARIYRYTTLYLRMLSNEHEYKVMGLAPYYTGSKREEVEKIFDKMLTLDGIEFHFNKEIPDIFNFLENNLNTFRFDHIASGLQKFTEKILVNWFTNLVDEYDSKSVVFSGGISMNVKANMLISNIPKIENFFICGAGTDETLPIGACYHHAELNGVSPLSLETMYLGEKMEYDENEINALKNYKISKYTNVEQILSHVLDNKIIAVCRGRMEMGQRALGNRSIIADPRNIENIQKINHSIKMRDFWMPFAPVVLFEKQEELLINTKKIDSPFMTITFNTIDGKKKIPVAVHQSDQTARAQILRKNQNPELWDLISKFYDKTGVPALVNTSFNLHGKPIVNNLQDALHVFENSGLDVLWLDNHIIEKIA
jgi:carbamoyltransferase